MRNLRNSYTNWCLQMKEGQFQCMFFLKLGGQMRRKHRNDLRQLEAHRWNKSSSFGLFSNCSVKSIMKMLVLWIIAMIIAQSRVEAEEDLEVTFDAKTVIEMRLTSRIKSSTMDNEITLLFKTIQPSGIIFLANGFNGDFIFMEMVRGKLRLALGTTVRGSRVIHKDILMEDNLCDNEWHQLNVEVRQDVTHARVDSFDPYQSRFSKKLNIDRKLVLGGLGEEDFNDISVSKRSYAGCLSYVKFNNIYVLRKLKKQRSDLEWTCKEKPKNDVINFDQATSNVMFPNPTSEYLKLGFRFRTYHRDGVLITNNAIRSLSVDNTKDMFTAFMLHFQNNALKLSLDGRIVISMMPVEGIDFGSWQTVEIIILQDRVTLILNRISKTYHLKRGRLRKFGNTISIGNGGERMRNFIGWIGNLTLDDKVLTYVNATKIKDVSIGIYQMKDMCYPNPCNNSGICVQTVNGSHCDCTNTGYTGNTCSQKVVDYKRTCKEYYENGQVKSGEYFIKPGTEAFKVFCDMEHTDGPVTRIPYDTLGKRKAIYESTSTDNRFYYHNIKYKVPMEQLKYLTEASAHCQQYIEYYCSKSTLMFSSDRIAALVNRYGARWYSRDGTIQNYWGGASKDSYKCACGMNSSCADNRLACNCDLLDGKWRSDGGYLRYKDDLPVTRLQFSKRNTNPGALYVLGPLECVGNYTETIEKSKTRSTKGKQTTKYTKITKIPFTTIAPTSIMSSTSTTELALSKQSLSTTEYATPESTSLPTQTLSEIMSTMKKTPLPVKPTTWTKSSISRKPDAFSTHLAIRSTLIRKNAVTTNRAFAKTGGSLSAEIAVTQKTVTRKTARVLVVHQPAKQSESVLSNKQMFILIALISSLTLFTILLIVAVLRQRIFSRSSKKLTVELKQDIENPNKYAFQLPNNNAGSFSDSNSQSRSMVDINKIEIVRVGSIFGKPQPSESEGSVNSFDASRYLEVGEESDNGSYTSFTKPKSILKGNKYILTSRPRSEGDQFDINGSGDVIGLIHMSGNQRNIQYDEKSELLENTKKEGQSDFSYHVRSKKDHCLELYKGGSREQLPCGRNESIDADTGFITDSSLSSNSRKSLSSSGSDESNEEFYMRKNGMPKKQSKRSVRFSLQSSAGHKLMHHECDDEVFT